MDQRRAEAIKRDPTLAVCFHPTLHCFFPLAEPWLTFAVIKATLNGNKPAKGARIDKELQQEDDDMVRKMEARKERKRSEGMLRVENRG